MTKVLRRQFIKYGALAAVTGMVPRSAQARAQTPECRLAFYSTHTGESLDVVYRIGDDYIAEALAQINHVLRDHRNNEVQAMRPELLDLLHALSTRLEAATPFQVISGYRSPDSNRLLAAQNEGVAKHSLHTEGKAIDIRLPGCDLPLLHRAAIALRLGGVGYYARSDFVHVDIGRVRYW
ncbi:MAG: DUF882 domain-containing protein [Burkholderiales bacterium]